MAETEVDGRLQSPLYEFRNSEYSLWSSKIRVPNFFFLGEGKVPLKYSKTERIEDVKVTTVHAFQSNEETA